MFYCLIMSNNHFILTEEICDIEMGLRSKKIGADNIQVSSNQKNKENIRLGSKKFWSPSIQDKNPFAVIKFDCKFIKSFNYFKNYLLGFNYSKKFI